MRKRIASIVLSVCLCLTLLPTAAFADEGGADPTPTTGTSGYDSEGFCTAYEWVSGKLAKKDGETCSHEDCNGYQPATDTDSDNYYEIGNAGQLYWFAAQVNGGNNTINGMLTKDIPINSDVLGTNGSPNSGTFKQWTPIGSTSGTGYQGTFDGNNKTISGLYYNCTDTGTDGTSYVGLFGRVYEGGMVKNFTLMYSYINSRKLSTNDIYIGGIVGYCAKGSIENCTVGYTVISGTRSDDNDDDDGWCAVAGGIVGRNSGTVKLCASAATVSATISNDEDRVEIGGIVGWNDGGTVSLCANSGKISGTGMNDSSKVGGVIGNNFTGSTGSNIIATIVTNCYNTGDVSGSNHGEKCGGVVGNNARSTITNCYNTGTVSDSSNVGGVVFKNIDGTITNCYYKADSETDSFDGTTHKTEADFKSGAVAYLLNGKTSTGDLVWYQTIGTDNAPTRDSDRGIVYCGYTTCAEDAEPIYTNTESDVSTTKPSHDFNENGECTGCTAVKYTVTFNPNGGTVDAATATTNTAGKLTALPTATRGGYTFNGWYMAADGGEQITTETVFNGHTTVYAHWTVVSSGSSSNTTSTTVKNPDGSTTTTVTDKKTGTVTETTKNTDGSTTTIETRKDGTVTETNKTATGTTSTTVTDKNGNSTTTVSVSQKDAQSGNTVTLPVDEVTAADSSEDAQEITVNVPSGGATVEIPVKNPTPGTVIVIVDKNGNETVVPTTKMTENGVSITLTEDATIKVIENSKDFSDVKSSDYFGKAVDWASSRGITGGNSATTFGPHDSCTRAQLVTFLWRAAGCPEPNATSSFSDVSAEAYYTKAVAWAFENGIVGGYGNGLFGSEDTITREQMAVILYRFAQHTGMDTTQGGMSVREYKDYESISDYAVTAIQWAVNAGVMQGYDGNLMPGQPCTRAQIVTMLYRLLGTN